MKGKKMFTLQNLVPLAVFGLGVLMMVMAIAQFVRNQDDDAFGARRKANEISAEKVSKEQYMKEMSDTNQWIGRVDNDRVALANRLSPTELKVADLIRKQGDRIAAEKMVFDRMILIEKRLQALEGHVPATPTPFPKKIQMQVDVIHSEKYPDDVKGYQPKKTKKKK